MPHTYDNCSQAVNDRPTGSVVDGKTTVRHPRRVLDTDELLAGLKAKGIKNVEIAKALGLPDSRIPEIRRKERALKLDEAVKLVRAFGLEREFEGSPLPASVTRLVVRYLALELGAEPTNQQLEDLTQDVLAFGEFVSDPRVRRSVEAAEGFFRALQLRRPAPEAGARPKSDHGTSR